MNKKLYTALAFIAFIIALPLQAKPLLIHGQLDQTERTIFLAFSLDSPTQFQAAKLSNSNQQSLAAFVAKEQPKPIIVLGDQAYAFAKEKFKNIPLIAVGISFDFARSQGRKEDKILLRDLPLENKLKIVKFLLPKIETIGLIYNPREDRRNVEQLVNKSKKQGLRLATVKIDASSSLADQLNVFKGAIELFWLIDSPTLSQQKTASQIAQFCQKNKIPLFVSNPQQMKLKGAVLSIRSSPQAVGTFAARWVKETIAKKNVPSVAFPQKAEIILNLAKIEQIIGNINILFDRLKKLNKLSHTISLAN